VTRLGRKIVNAILQPTDHSSARLLPPRPMSVGMATATYQFCWVLPSGLPRTPVVSLVCRYGRADPQVLRAPAAISRPSTTFAEKFQRSG
jgi:hypothetical protein